MLLDAVEDDNTQDESHIAGRAEPRLNARQMVYAELQGQPDSKPFAVKLWNVSPDGVCVVARNPIEVGKHIRLTPDGNPRNQPLLVVVARCTQTILGFLIGCTAIGRPSPD